MKRSLSLFLALALLVLTPVQALAIAPDDTARSLVCLDREYNFLSGAEYSAISSTNEHTALLRPDGSLWMFGSNYEGQLGIGTERQAYNAPIQVLEDVVQVKTGHNTTTALKTDGSVWAFGEWIGAVPTKIVDEAIDADVTNGYVAWVDTKGQVWLQEEDSSQPRKLAEDGAEVRLFYNSFSGLGLLEGVSSKDMTFQEAVSLDLPRLFILVRHTDGRVVQHEMSRRGGFSSQPITEGVERMTVYCSSGQYYVTMFRADGTVLYGDLEDGTRSATLPDCVDALDSPVGLYILKHDGSLWNQNKNLCLGSKVKLFGLCDDLAAFMIHEDNTVSLQGIRDNYADKLALVNHVVLQAPDNTPMYEDIYAKTMEIVGNETDKYRQAKLVCEWIVTNIDYQHSNHDQSGVDAFRQGSAVCAGFSSLTSIMLSYLDIPVASPWTLFHGSSNHAWNIALIDGAIVVIDNTSSAGLQELTMFDYPFFEGRTPEDGTYTRELCDSWAVNEVRAAYDHDLVDVDLGYDYRKAISRENFCSLVRAVIEQAQGQSIDAVLAAQGKGSLPVPFTDSNNPDVAAMYRLGVINGTSPTTFAPTRTITRQEAAKIMRSLALTLGQDVTAPAPSFADNGAMDSWAMDGVAFVAHNGIMNGRPTGFDPKNTISAQESILICCRYLGAVTE